MVVEQLGDYFHMLSGCPVPAVRILGMGWILSGSEAEPWLDWIVCFWLMVLIIYLMVDHFRSFFLTWSLAPHVLIEVEVFFFFRLEERFGVRYGFIKLPLHLGMFFRPLPSSSFVI
jgi:hypothetical protein